MFVFISAMTCIASIETRFFVPSVIGTKIRVIKIDLTKLSFLGKSGPAEADKDPDFFLSEEAEIRKRDIQAVSRLVLTIS